MTESTFVSAVASIVAETLTGSDAVVLKLRNGSARNGFDAEFTGSAPTAES